MEAFENQPAVRCLENEEFAERFEEQSVMNFLVRYSRCIYFLEFVNTLRRPFHTESALYLCSYSWDIVLDV